MVEPIESAFGGQDILVNNNGVFHTFDVKDEAYPFEKQVQEIETDFVGPVRMIHACLPLLKKAWKLPS